MKKLNLNWRGASLLAGLTLAFLLCPQAATATTRAP